MVNLPIMKIGVERILILFRRSDAGLVFRECITRVKIGAKSQPFKGSKTIQGFSKTIQGLFFLPSQPEPIPVIQLGQSEFILENPSVTH